MSIPLFVDLLFRICFPYLIRLLSSSDTNLRGGSGSLEKRKKKRIKRKVDWKSLFITEGESLYLYNNFTNLANRKWPTYFTLGLILFGRHKTTKYFINNGLLLYLWPTLLFTYGHLIFHEGHPNLTSNNIVKMLD